MTLVEAMAKATKLFRLADSSNANEAALAAQRAQEILARYNISKATLALDGNGASEPEEAIGKNEDWLDEGKKNMATWKSALALAVAKANGCRVYLSGPAIGIVGRATDVQKVRYMYALLFVEIDRLTAAGAKGMGRTFANSFRLGAVAAISEKLRAAQTKVVNDMRSETSGEGLVLLNRALDNMSQRDAAVDAWMRANMNLRSKNTSSRRDGEGYAAGHRAGQGVNVGGGRAVGSGRKMLGS